MFLLFLEKVGEEEAVINDPEDDNPEGYPPPGGLSDDVPDPEEVAAEVPKAARRIKAFEDFIQEDGDGSTSTVIKKVRYSDDATEPEDYGVPVAASADPMAEDSHYDGEKRGEDDEHKGDEDEDRGDKKVDDEDDRERADHYKGAVKSDDKEIKALKKDKEHDEKEEKKAKADESYVRSFGQFVDEEYDKVVWGRR